VGGWGGEGVGRSRDAGPARSPCRPPPLSPPASPDLAREERLERGGRRVAGRRHRGGPVARGRVRRVHAARAARRALPRSRRPTPHRAPCRATRAVRPPKPGAARSAVGGRRWRPPDARPPHRALVSRALWARPHSPLLPPPRRHETLPRLRGGPAAAGRGRRDRAGRLARGRGRHVRAPARRGRRPRARRRRRVVDDRPDRPGRGGGQAGAVRAARARAARRVPHRCGRAARRAARGAPRGGVGAAPGPDHGQGQGAGGGWRAWRDARPAPRAPTAPCPPSPSFRPAPAPAPWTSS